MFKLIKFFGEINVKVQIKCESNYMEVLVEKKYFTLATDFRLNDPTCNFNSGHITDNGDEAC